MLEKRSTNRIDDGYIGSGRNIVKAVKKYGKENFVRIILHYCISAEHALEIEKQIVDEWFISRKDTYNLVPGGNGGNTYQFADEKTKERLRESSARGGKWHKGKPSARKGRTLEEMSPDRADEIKDIMSKANKGKPSEKKGKKLSLEHCQKIKDSLKNGHPKGMKGKTHSPETKEKMRLAHLKRKLSI